MLRATVLVAVLLVSMLWPPAMVSSQSASQTFPETGFTVADTAQGRFLSEFRRLGGVDAFGYPISDPFVSAGFTYQAFQRAVLQWRPELDQALLANSMDWLSDAGKDPWLATTYGVPGPLKDSGGSWQQVVAEREAWMTEPAIAQAYRSNGGYDRLGLPASKPEARGPFVVQRFQRYVFQLWTAEVAGMPPKGSVVGVLVGDMLKQAGLIGPAPAQPTPPPTPAAAPCKVVVDLFKFTKGNADQARGDLQVSNQCSYPVHVMIDLVTRTDAGVPTGESTLRVENVAPGEARTVSGVVPAPSNASRIGFAYSWGRANNADLACWDVGSGQCLRHDVWLANAIMWLEDLNPETLRLLQVAAQNDVRVVRGTTNNAMLVTYDRATKTITVDAKLNGESSWVQAAFLAHALQHAADDLSGAGGSCGNLEQAAYKRTIDTWNTLWKFQLPRAWTDLHGQLNDLANWMTNDPGGFVNTLMSKYGTHC